ncbi:MAG TPA: hypothetical protein VMG60_14420 [Burkholderiaceae bacterium]|nr:hypothetical protein [Burkholderiaceae bacterium]
MQPPRGQEHQHRRTGCMGSAIGANVDVAAQDQANFDFVLQDDAARASRFITGEHLEAWCSAEAEEGEAIGVIRVRHRVAETPLDRNRRAGAARRSLRPLDGARVSWSVFSLARIVRRGDISNKWVFRHRI